MKRCLELFIIYKNRGLNLVYHFLGNWKSAILNFFSILFLLVLFYFFVYDLNSVNFIALFISSVISFSISIFILDNYNFSNSSLIKFLQKFLLYFFIFVITLIFFNLGDVYCDGGDSDSEDNTNNNSNNNITNSNINTNNNNDNNNENYNFSLPKKVVDNTMTIVGKTLTNVAPDLGVGAAVGAATSAMVKSTTAMAPAPRLALIGATSAITAAGAKTGLSAAKAASKNIDLSESIKNSKYGSASKDSLPSPDDSFINSPLDSEIPLLDILDSLYTFNKLELILLILFIYLYLNKYIYEKVLSFLNKGYLDKNIKIKNILINTVKLNDNIRRKFLILIFILLIIFKLLNIFFFNDLYSNIDDYVLVYNSIKTNAVLFISCFNFNCLNVNSNLISFNKIFVKNYSDTNINKNMKFDDYLNMDLDSKLKIFGSYDNYLTNLYNEVSITDEFMIKYYPDFVNDELFRMILNEIYIIYRTKTNIVIKIYFEIKKFNSFKDKIFLLNEYLDKKNIIDLLKSYNDSRNDIISLLKDLGYKDNQNVIFDKLLFKVSNKMKKKILLDSSILKNDDLNLISFEDDYIQLVEFLKNLVKKDLKLRNDNIDKIIDKDGVSAYSLTNYEDVESIINGWNNNLLKIFKLLKYIEINKLSKKELLILKYKDLFFTYCKTDKYETYKIKKGTSRKRLMSGGKILSGYSHIIYEFLNELEIIIFDSFSSFFNDDNIKHKLNNEDLLDNVDSLNQIVNNDYLDLFQKVVSFYKVNDFLLSISKNLSENNLNDQYNKFMLFYKDIMSKTSHDELIHFYEILNKLYNLDSIFTDDNNLNKVRESSLSTNSFLYLSCKDIIDNNELNLDQRQLLLEEFILKYEKEFIYNLIKNMNNNLIDYKLLTKIYKHSTPQFKDRIKVYIDNNKKRNYQNFFINKDNIAKLGDQLSLALLISIDIDQLVNIVFSKVVRLIGLSGGITQNELLVSLSNEMLITFNYNIKNNFKNLKDKLSEIEREIVLDTHEKINDIPFESKYQFGDFLLELLLEEFEYIFEKQNLYENNEHYIYISIKQQYLAVLTSSIFNPIRLPMIVKPKNWEYLEYENKKIIVTQIGGYYLDQFNELSKNNDIIRKNSTNKFDSILSKDQINTVNFLNKRSFVINKDLLDYIINEWNNKFQDENSIFKGFNKLHNLTENFNSVNLNTKKEILSHNSKYWSYTNIINIALLMKNQTIYFPTFLDFRGRIYPTPNYLSYQSSDLARSLLLFGNDNTTNLNNSGNKDDLFENIIQKILEDDVYNYKYYKKKSKEIKLNDIDYFKLYVANVFGKNKLTRKNKISWFDKNINTILVMFEENFNLFKVNFLLKSKEPFQFLGCIINYNNYVKFNIEIKMPILFDASCSGIQHLSALTTDIKIAKLVNLLDNEEPYDFYQYCTDQINSFILNNTKKDISLIIDKFKYLNINRKWLKHCIMTIPYNVTDIGISEKLIKYFDVLFIPEIYLKTSNLGEVILNDTIDNILKIEKKVKTNNEKKNFRKGINIYLPKEQILLDKSKNNLFYTKKELFFFSKFIKTTVLNIIPPFNELKIYFDKTIDILKKLNLTIYWDTPSGMTVNMSNIVLKSKPIKTSLIKKAKPIKLLIPTEQIDYRTIKNGFMPNFIHSLDASNIHLLIRNIENMQLYNINLYTIHDCFASDYKSISIIELLVKHSFVQLYFRKNYLESVHNSFLLQIQCYANILEEETNLNKKIKYILIPKKESINKSKFNNSTAIEKIEIPNLPDYNWNINKEIIKNDLLFNNYFIS